MPQDAAAGDQADIKSRTEGTIARLAELLEAAPSAEELFQSWARSKAETAQRDGPRLQDLRRALDAGKVIEKGVPMWIVVRMCKATWHRDGTWPLLGADEELSSAMKSMGITRSIHPSARLLRPEGISSFQVPAEEADTNIRQRNEPTAEEIAASYRRRGLFVEDVVRHPDDW